MAKPAEQRWAILRSPHHASTVCRPTSRLAHLVWCAVKRCPWNKIPSGCAQYRCSSGITRIGRRAGHSNCDVKPTRKQRCTATAGANASSATLHRHMAGAILPGSRTHQWQRRCRAKEATTVLPTLWLRSSPRREDRLDMISLRAGSGRPGLRFRGNLGA